jgi:hypothetical protein
MKKEREREIEGLVILELILENIASENHSQVHHFAQV